MTDERVCGRCGESVRTVWATGCQLRDECAMNDCEWYGEPYTPPQREVETERTMPASHGCGGWTYSVVDQYGHPLVAGRGYSTEAEAESEARKDLARYAAPPTGPCQAVVWPPTVVVKGRLLT